MLRTSTSASQSALEKRRNGSDWFTRTLNRAFALGAQTASGSPLQKAVLTRYFAYTRVDGLRNRRFDRRLQIVHALVRDSAASIATARASDMSDAGSQIAVVTVYSMSAAHVAGTSCVIPTPQPRASMSPAVRDVVVAERRFRASGHRVEDLDQLIRRCADRTRAAIP